MKISTPKALLTTVKLGPSRQIAIPKKVHDQLGLTPGTIFEVQIRAGSLVYTPKSLADWEGRQAYLEARAGHGLSPVFNTAAEGIAHLHSRVAKRNHKSK